jgi:hypothetical protein
MPDVELQAALTRLEQGVRSKSPNIPSSAMLARLVSDCRSRAADVVSAERRGGGVAYAERQLISALDNYLAGDVG